MVLVVLVVLDSVALVFGSGLRDFKGKPIVSFPERSAQEVVGWDVVEEGSDTV